MSNIINLQLSVFCNKHIEPTPEKTTALMNKINSLSGFEFLPSIVNGQNIDILTRQVTNISNLALITKDQLFQVLCMDNRIDIIFNTPSDSTLDYEQHLSIAENILVFIMATEEIVGNRLAFNIKLISADKIESIDSFTSKYGKLFRFYEGKSVEDWMLRYNSRETIDLAGNAEILNVVTSLNMIKNADATEKRILCHMDINTLAEKAISRFSSEALSSFNDAIKPIVKSIEASFGGIDCDK